MTFLTDGTTVRRVPPCHQCRRALCNAYLTTNDDAGLYTFRYLESFTKFDMLHLEAKHLHLCYNNTCNALPQYLWQGIHPNRTLQEIF